MILNWIKSKQGIYAQGHKDFYYWIIENKENLTFGAILAIHNTIIGSSYGFSSLEIAQHHITQHHEEIESLLK